MSTPVPIEQLQMVGESYQNWQYRLQQLSPPLSGPNQGMAQQWLDKFALHNAPAPSGFTIR